MVGMKGGSAPWELLGFGGMVYCPKKIKALLHTQIGVSQGFFPLLFFEEA